MSGIIQDFIEIVASNIRNASQVVSMAKVMLKKRYSGSLLGIVWALVKPTIYCAVYWFVMAVGIRGSGKIEGVSYGLWMIPGIMVWFFFSDVLTDSGSSILDNRHLVTKMVYAVETIPVSSVLSFFFVHLMMMGIVLAIFILSGFGIGVYLIQLPYYMLCGLLLSFVVAFLLSALSAVSKDFKYVVRSLITALFWLTPSLWSITKLAPGLKRIIMLNPFAYVVLGYRNCFVSTTWFFQQLRYTLYFWVVLAVLALVAVFVFKKLKNEFADVL